MLRNVHQCRNGMYYAAVCNSRTCTDIYNQWELRTGTDEIDGSVLHAALTKSVVDHKRARADTMSGMMRSVVPRMTGM